MSKSDNVPLSKLKGWEQNPRGIKKDDYDRLKKQIQDLGVYKPLLVNEDYVVLGGNMRLKVLNDLGVDNVWVSVVKANTPELMAKYALSDNDEAGYYDEQQLAELLTPLEINLEDYKVNLGKPISITELLAKFGPDIIEDEPPTVEEEAISKRGEIYQLGRHRLACGDSTKIEEVDRLLDGKKADMVFTDPPYGVGRDGGFEGMEGFGGFGKPIARKKYKGDWDDNIPPKECFDKILTLAKNIIIFGGNYFAHYLPQGTHWIVWDKKQTMPTFGDCELAWTNSDRKSVKKYEVTYNGLIGKEKERVHATQKPVKICTDILQDYSKQDDIVLDLFGGSGSTLIACEQTNRTCHMMELDPKYVDVIRKRYAKFINKEEEWETATPKI